MSTTSVKPIPTLKGIFSEPKIQHRKDFLRENKLNLRELQRVTTKNKSSQQQELQQKQQRQQQLHQQQQQQYVNRRSASQQRNPPPKQKPPSRSTSQQNGGKLQTIMPTKCSSYKGDGFDDMFGKESRTTLISKAESCNKEIQTDDINDEEFLYEALKKCSSSESNCHTSTKINLSDANQKPFQCEAKVLNKIECTNSDQDYDCENPQKEERQIHTPRDRDDLYHHHNNDNEDLNSARSNTARSQFSGINNHRHQSQTEEQYQDLNLETLAIDNHCNQQQHMPLSGGSRRTNCSDRSQEGPLTKKKSTGSVHKCGNREDVRLPRYLEREKREKEEQRMREEVRDPNCPIGHFALTNDERMASLSIAEKKFKLLVNELNHMPMTMETLRIRTRKAEIEKELAILEADIRIYSKQKVYVKQQESQE